MCLRRLVRHPSPAGGGSSRTPHSLRGLVLRGSRRRLLSDFSSTVSGDEFQPQEAVTPHEGTEAGAVAALAAGTPPREVWVLRGQRVVDPPPGPLLAPLCSHIPLPGARAKHVQNIWSPTSAEVPRGGGSLPGPPCRLPPACLPESSGRGRRESLGQKAVLPRLLWGELAPVSPWLFHAPTSSHWLSPGWSGPLA